MPISKLSGRHPDPTRKRTGEAAGVCVPQQAGDIGDLQRIVLEKRYCRFVAYLIEFTRVAGAKHGQLALQAAATRIQSARYRGQRG
jgi:hypothetical protein